ncbi:MULTISPECIES: SDR family NAD(P)-dependent oxidoreductase [unclassified Ruegeria]|uniref:SDR family NAD(P)-dependent oxidoreductase n=1 Tax=unclassified Ruegeria TaxID=2625375 RepID=UPI0014896D8B|nr:MULTISPECIES: SDR family oxidoreductase [unclassified Ruegeria]
MTTDLNKIYGLSGKQALVTGGGSGLGLAIAQCLSRAGARVIIAGRRTDVLRKACDDIGGNTAWHQLDLSDVDSVAAQAQAIRDTHGPIDILVNNAGNTVKKPFLDSGIAEFDSVFDVHVRGALELTRALVPDQIEAGAGAVLFTSSMTAFIGQPSVLGYTTAKTALTGVVRGLSAELSSQGVRVNAVAPGWIDTDLYRKATAGDLPRQQKILSRIPMERLGAPEDIGWTCAFLASPAAKYITGQVVLVDGGAATGF